jgi:hypothetical protein
MLWHTWLVAGFYPWSTGCDSWPLYVEFVVRNVAVRPVLSKHCLFPLTISFHQCVIYFRVSLWQSFKFLEFKQCVYYSSFIDENQVVMWRMRVCRFGISILRIFIFWRWAILHTLFFSSFTSYNSSTIRTSSHSSRSSGFQTCSSLLNFDFEWSKLN